MKYPNFQSPKNQYTCVCNEKITLILCILDISGRLFNYQVHQAIHFLITQNAA